MSTFRFKQFTIHQEKAQMKVGTDSIVLDSAIKIKSKYKRILDVGTGTGLLSLMIAQKSSNQNSFLKEKIKISVQVKKKK